MSDPSLPVQDALILAIKALATSAGNNVFDMVPATDPFPRVTVGQGQAVPVDADCYPGAELTFQIDAWSRKVGFPEVKQIGAAIWNRLHDGALTITGFVLDLMLIESVIYERDPDGLTSRARITLRAQVQPAA